MGKFLHRALLVLAMSTASVVVLPGAQARADEFHSANLRWNPPSSGSPAVTYLVRIRDLDGDLDQTYTVNAQGNGAQTFEFTQVQFVHRYQGRVAAVDNQGRQGPWSEWTAVYDSELPPPQP